MFKKSEYAFPLQALPEGLPTDFGVPACEGQPRFGDGDSGPQINERLYSPEDPGSIYAKNVA